MTKADIVTNGIGKYAELDLSWLETYDICGRFSEVPGSSGIVLFDYFDYQMRIWLLLSGAHGHCNWYMIRSPSLHHAENLSDAIYHDICQPETYNVPNQLTSAHNSHWLMSPMRMTSHCNNSNIRTVITFEMVQKKYAFMQYSMPYNQPTWLSVSVKMIMIVECQKRHILMKYPNNKSWLFIWLQRVSILYQPHHIVFRWLQKLIIDWYCVRRSWSGSGYSSVLLTIIDINVSLSISKISTFTQLSIGNSLYQCLETMLQVSVPPGTHKQPASNCVHSLHSSEASCEV